MTLGASNLPDHGEPFSTTSNWTSSSVPLSSTLFFPLKVKLIHSGRVQREDSTSLGDEINLNLVSEVQSNKLEFRLEHGSYPVLVLVAQMVKNLPEMG